MLAVAAANGVIALQLLGASGSAPQAAASETHHSEGVRLLPPAKTDPPVVLPPAATTTVPAAPSDPAPSPAQTGPALDFGASSDAQAAAPLVNGTPIDITDPTTVAHATVGSLALYRYPGAPSPEGSLANPNQLGAPLVLMVTAIEGNWIQTYVPLRPNEATAWVQASQVTLGSVPCHIAVGIGAHKLVLYCNNAPVYEAPVATGAPDAPTPTGSYFVAYIVKLTDPGGPYGPYAMGLSAFSNTYFSFEGGPGQIGIHGTDQPWVIGSYASHGCVRLNNSDITQLAGMVAPGTPVEIGS